MPSRGGAAPPKLQHLFPSGGKRGASVDVTASGTFDKWPAEIWVNRAGVEVVAGKDKGTFKISIAADAEAGVYWLRAFHAEGASSFGLVRHMSRLQEFVHQARETPSSAIHPRYTAR